MICDDVARRERMAKSLLNGIDYIEVVTRPAETNQRLLKVFFTPKKTVQGRQSLTKMLEDLDGATNKIVIKGGIRVPDIAVISVKQEDDHLIVGVKEPGDFSTYTLCINHSKMDVMFSRRPFSFKAGCPSDFDCHGEIVCPPEPKKELRIDYLAKDYASFRQALLDLIPSIIPGWQERHEADLGIALVELFAYVGDQLSYYQDAVANEAYLETARQRESVKRHARLIDYRMHDGASARVFVHLELEPGTSGRLPTGTQILSRIGIPLGVNMPPHGPVISNVVRTQALSAADVVFETIEEADLDSILNEIKIHTWANKLCCVPKGATTLELTGDLPFGAGDFLLLEEVKGPETGLPADADPKHRQVVRLTKAEKTGDSLMGKDLTRVTWDSADALSFPLCVSAKLTSGSRKGEYEPNISVARGNLVLADHGRTIRDERHPGLQQPVHPSLSRAHRVRLKEGPLSVRIPVPKDDNSPTPAKYLLTTNPRRAKPQVTKLSLVQDATVLSDDWQPVPDLLDSGPFDQHFVVETKNDGRAVIRFGNGEFGMKPPERAHLNVTYRVGSGTAGNVGAETLVHILEPEPGEKRPDWPKIKEEDGVSNPLPAWGGVDPEPIKQVQLLAPKAFHAEQFRAVTEEDYARTTEKHAEVDKAVATFRWTGSWHTVFITIDPMGRTEVTPELEARVRSHITRHKLAGYDIEIDSPDYVSLEIEINVCVARDHFRAHVKAAVLEALSNRDFPGGRKGFFHPDNFTFGQPVYLSRLYEALEQVKGVDSAEVTLFKRHSKVSDNELKQGYIPMGRLEIARLDNDPSFPENGVLRLNMMGGK